jgi:hypothetical protein
MPLYYRLKDAAGRIQMVEQPEVRLTPQPVIAPLTPTVDGVGMRRYSCTACDPPKPFASAGVMAMHFTNVHKDLWTTKNSWRQYVLEFGDLHGPHRR